MFEKSLQDIVKGIRANKRDPSVYISQVIQEIKQELKSSDPFIKALAIRKLTYLQMMGYDMSWAAFQVVEVRGVAKTGRGAGAVAGATGRPTWVLLPAG